MSSLSKKPYKGCRDFFPHEKRKFDYIFNKIKSICESFAYEAYDGPLLEPIDVYYAKSGQEIVNEQLYSFTDRGDRHVAIRPEMTPTLARMVAQIHREVSKPLRWYSVPNLMRYEKPQRGRLREHWQLNCDIFGAPENFGEIEILQLLIAILTGLGAQENQFQILVNDRKIVDALFQDVLKLNEDLSYKLYKIIDKSKKVSAESLEKMLRDSFSKDQSIIILEYLNISTSQQLIDFSSKYELAGKIDQIINLFSQFNALQLDKYLTYDPSIVRGLDYYTGIVFEAFDLHPENKRAICGGGSYANLLQIFKESPLAGIGFGLGDVTLTDFLETHGLLPDLSNAPTDILLTYQDENSLSYALSLSQKIRDSHSFNIELHPSPIKLKKVFQIAQKKNISHAIFIGEQEVQNNSFSIKNLNTKEQQTLSFNDISSLRIES